MEETRDHGGNLDAAMARWGGEMADWVDLSTGINRLPYPVPEIPARAWQALPTRSDMARLVAAARSAYGSSADIVPVAGAQAAIQSVPFLRAPGVARVLSPTYNEHAAALRMGGWLVTEVDTVLDLTGAELAVIVSPNNPDGRRFAPEALRDLAMRVGMLVVDESFGDARPEATVARFVLPENVLVLRSFGKFYGLAGVRLGFALGHGPLVDRLRAMAGPWPVSGPAIQIACAALDDTAWQAKTVARLHGDCARMDRLAQAAGWRLVGGTELFRTYDTLDASHAQEWLAEARVWSRIFPYSGTWIRLGLPAPQEWAQVEAALTAV
ncbi:threonine-phosphate decarboxylase CobD [Sagittula salina]|uniref:threonine-phosphate decarboxylase n=1 Tax=Sagittula salina TaxID=2820268 RepID=A0A940S256_9RHOB|nr:threonine-phosphate decarboxylase CobD [Sagittula salina]MBP0484878.1 threonine-phosphate decarboxylase [Sagittula salina]